MFKCVIVFPKRNIAKETDLKSIVLSGVISNVIPQEAVGGNVLEIQF